MLPGSADTQNTSSGDGGGFNMGSMGNLLQILGPALSGYGIAKGNVPMSLAGLMPLLMRLKSQQGNAQPLGQMMGNIGSPPMTPNFGPQFNVPQIPQMQQPGQMYGLNPPYGGLGFKLPNQGF